MVDERSFTRCVVCGDRLYKVVEYAVRLGAPQVCGPCIDKDWRERMKEGNVSNIPFKPRGEYVILRYVDLGKSRGGVVIPETSREGKAWYVEAVGPKVEDLKPGMRVEAMGEVGMDIARIPGSSDLFITKQANILLVHDGEEGEQECSCT